MVLRVNDRIATLFDYRERLAARRALLARDSSMDSAAKQEILATLPSAVLKEIFDELLMLSRADQLGIRVTEIEVQEAVNNLREQSGIETDEQFRQALANDGWTEEAFRQQLSQRILWNRVQQREVFPRIDVGEDELRAAYDENAERFRVPEQRRVEEVVVLESEGLSAADQQRIAGEIRDALIQGGDLRQEAELRGAETASFVEIGWVATGDLASELETAVWALQPGEISEPVSFRGGVHVLRLAEVKAATVRPFEEVRDGLLAQERARRLDVELDSYLEELELKSFFEGDPPPEAQGFRTASGRTLSQGSGLLELAQLPAAADDQSNPDG